MAEMTEPAKTLRAVVQWAAGDVLVYWENEPRPQLANMYVLLSWVTTAAVGQTDVEQSDTSTDLVTHQLLAVQIAVESFVQDDRVMRVARKVAASLHHQFLEDQLAAIELALSSVGAISRADYPADNRMVARALFEARWTYAETLTDSIAPVGTIEHVQLVPDLQGDDSLNTPFEVPST